MPRLSGAALRSRLQARQFTELFVEELGWDRLRGVPDVVLHLAGTAERLKPVAQKRDVPLYLYRASPLPDRLRRRAIESALARQQREHLVVFADDATGAQVWQWVKREPGRPDRVREHAWRLGDDPESLRQKLDALQFTLEEEDQGRIGATDVTDRLRRAFDADQVTRRFYDEFKRRHDALKAFLRGLPNEGTRSWYASVTLNRLMFIYFIQKRGFLGGDADYLNRLLDRSRRERGKDRFFAEVLCPLFFRGFALPEAQRDAADRALLGPVPYLNGGLFQEHQIEREHGEHIALPDRAFADLFAFFDSWRWHLDERRTDDTRDAQATGREINPDVLGYIFEKYVNQKQMGAYYTKEDVTGYICANTILPYLLDKVAGQVRPAFTGPDSLWRLLRQDPDRYIWPSVRHGADLAVPEIIEAGVNDVSLRGEWNRPATRDVGLPTETWREVVHRRARLEELRAQLRAGEVASPDVMVTANLDLFRFTADAIGNASEDGLKAWWGALKELTVLDPACGSGAFLFAALNLLEPLYTAVFEAMQTTVADARRAAEAVGRPFDARRYRFFTDVLEEAARHPNAPYFILRQIALNNLFGVDIMEEAVEICKLRLFLQLVAQLDDPRHIEPLPDLDFNIRSGNSLVGFVSEAALDAAEQSELDLTGAAARIKEGAEIAAKAYLRFRQMQEQAPLDARELADVKEELRTRLAGVAAAADELLAWRFGVPKDRPDLLVQWQRSHEPFHWATEFYGVMHGGGFGVVIGNPPFLEATEVGYSIAGFRSATSRAVHGVFVERFRSLGDGTASFGIVLPMSVVSTQRMQVVQQVLESGTSSVYVNFAWRPATLFEGVNRAITVAVCVRSVENRTFSTGYVRWTADSRAQLLNRIAPLVVPKSRRGWAVPKLSSPLERDILDRLERHGKQLNMVLGGNRWPIYYKSTGGLYWKVFTDFPPSFSSNGITGSSSRQKTIYVSDGSQRGAVTAILNSSLFWWWYTIHSNLRDLNPSDINEFRIPLGAESDEQINQLGAELMASFQGNSRVMVRRQRTTGETRVQSFRVKLSKNVIDSIDRRLITLLGLSANFADFITSYDASWRLSAFAADEAIDDE